MWIPIIISDFLSYILLFSFVFVADFSLNRRKKAFERGPAWAWRRQVLPATTRTSLRMLGLVFEWNWHGYGSIPINTIFSGMNIHLPAILGFTRYQGFDPSPHSFWHVWKDVSETMSDIWKDIYWHYYDICLLTFFLASYLASILTLWLASFCEGMNGYPLLNEISSIN